MRVSLLSVTPVKSLAVHHPESVRLGEEGVVGDRSFFLIDDDGTLVNCAAVGDLLQYRAEFDEMTGRLDVHGPDGLIRSGPVTVGEAVDTDFYGLRRVQGDVVDGWDDLFSEITGRPVRLVRGRSGGFDVAGVTLLGSSSVEALAARSAAVPVDSQRFRMNVEITGSSPLEEDTWQGRDLRVGDAVLKVGGPVLRCAATTRNPGTGVVDLQTLQMIGAYRGRLETEAFGLGFYFGVYADVVVPGEVRVGDSVALV